ncbi:MAG: hypothetical protein NVV73_17175 [Cellvibrionaceae bacterium]|nr:hypothetical protein [Cellvibrionaceae bacterium]
MMKTLRYGLFAVLSLCFTEAFSVQEAHTFAPPNQNFTDEFFVNLISGQVSPTLSTISIGGDLGLSHSISIYANDFDGSNGYTDKFAGFIRSVSVGENILVDETTICQFFSVMRAHSPIATTDFKVMRKIDNKVACYPGVDMSGGYYYEPLGDTRHKLEIIDNGTKLKWTTEDGSQILFRRAQNGTTGREDGRIEQIIYPNGFTVTIGASSVTTNTGYQLKYIHEGSAWYKMPRYIKAINNAIEPCSQDSADTCNRLEKDWPSAEFIWPENMPAAMMSGENLFKVIGPSGEETHYKYAAHDLSLKEELGEHVFVGSPVNRKISPRLVGIKPSYSEEFVYRYQYKNNFMLESVGTNQGAAFERNTIGGTSKTRPALSQGHPDQPVRPPTRSLIFTGRLSTPSRCVAEGNLCRSIRLSTGLEARCTRRFRIKAPLAIFWDTPASSINSIRWEPMSSMNTYTPA